MLDQYGRVINYLRISVTDRCNLRCCYCMPEGVQDVGMKNILTFEEIWEIVRTGVSLGITHIRITGGEPLVRKGCVDLIRGIREIPGVETITMTTWKLCKTVKRSRCGQREYQSGYPGSGGIL